ncbi:MAG: hypothetical protein M3071_12350 [Actinomycetota bacterium]|nr:hypothetical protein [Actinomycetota bacterium]
MHTFDVNPDLAMEVTGRLLPLAPSPSRLPWTEDNLRFCPSCDQLVPKDLNFCPSDGRPLSPLGRPFGREPEAEAT